jgi:MFS family permease
MSLKRAIVIFMIATAFLGMAGGIFETSYNNYLSDTFSITAEQRGDLELPREFPGFMVAVMAGALFFLGDANLSLLASVLIGLGMFGLATLANHQGQYGTMIACTVAWSAGAHLMMPTTQAITLDLSESGRAGEQLGRLGSVRAVATVLGCGLVIANFHFLPKGYSSVFTIGALTAAGAVVAFMALHRLMPPVHHTQRRRLVLKGRYRVYYLLSILYGARKQVFITFGPWVLIRVFRQGAPTIAWLWIIATALTVFVLPYVGRLVDRIGPRIVLSVDSVLLLAVCMTYGFARDVVPGGAAFFVVCAAYVMDQMLAPVQMARTVYLSRIAEHRRDLTGSLSMGVSIDHAVSIPIAMLGGRLWDAAGYRWVFAAAGVVAMITLAACQLIRAPAQDALTAQQAPA